ncbi:DUF222 domain-containing protein [Nocardia sp. CA-128927]|uniref:HNH endonuclease signature motif containing protein n=1 Tax=Nocardia sp. CA-128927 TaxID=3239975 RepID=UPI003D96D753
MSKQRVEWSTDEEMVPQLRDAHRAAAIAQSREIELLVALYRQRRAREMEFGVNAAYAGQSAATEAAMMLRISQRQADTLIDLGLALEFQFPCTRAAFTEGRIDLPRARVIFDVLRAADREVIDRLEQRIVRYAETADPNRVRRTLRRWLLEEDPAGQTARRESAEADRYVQIKNAGDGTSFLEGVLPAAGGQTLYARLREMATTECCARDPRTVHQRRADALVALADGTGHLICGCGQPDCRAAGSTEEYRKSARKALIQVGVSADTLAGLADNPAFLAGYGAIDPTLARQLARHAQFVVIPDAETALASDTDQVGGIDSAATTTNSGSARHDLEAPMTEPHSADDAELRYRPSAALAARVRAIDGTCRAPGCGVPAAAADLDHQRPFDHRNPAQGGRTSGDNLGGLCRRHHRLKTLADNGRNGWTVVHHAGRLVEWCTPGGEIVTTEPEGAGYLFPERAIPPSSPREAENATAGGALGAARKPYELRSVIDTLTDPDPMAVHLGELIALQQSGPLRLTVRHVSGSDIGQPAYQPLLVSAGLRNRSSGDEPPPF